MNGIVIKFEAGPEPCVFCGGKMHLTQSGGSAGMTGKSSYYWEEQCTRCLSTKQCTDGQVTFIRSGHPLSLDRKPSPEAPSRSQDKYPLAWRGWTILGVTAVGWALVWALGR